MRERLEELGKPSFWSPPEDATPEQVAEFEAYMAKMLVPDESITTWIDISGDPLERKWAAIHEHVTQIATTARSCSSASTAGARPGSKEAYILRESRVPTTAPETDLFAGIA